MENQAEKGRTRFRRIKIVLIVIITLGVIILVYPFVPAVKYQVIKPKAFYPYQTKLANSHLNLGQLPEVKERKSLPADNRLVIPKIGVDVAIVEGRSESASLLKGAWHIPDTSDPVAGGNMVISGHRFRFRPPNNTTFYLLDKLAVSDLFIVYWQGKEYDYQISETKIINPDQVEILDNTSQPQVTLYTCTPLFTTRQRLIVIGKLLEL